MRSPGQRLLTSTTSGGARSRVDRPGDLILKRWVRLVRADAGSDPSIRPPRVEQCRLEDYPGKIEWRPGGLGWEWDFRPVPVRPRRPMSDMERELEEKRLGRELERFDDGRD